MNESQREKLILSHVPKETDIYLKALYSKPPHIDLPIIWSDDDAQEGCLVKKYTCPIGKILLPLYSDQIVSFKLKLI